MFNYTRNDQTIKKPMDKSTIETKVSMPQGMQPIPAPPMDSQPTTTCIYPSAPIKPPPVMKPSAPIKPPPVMKPSKPELPQPTMQYPCSEPMSDMAKCHNDMEIAYLKKMYPPVCQKIQRYINGELNQYDHDLSPIYEMYPAAETLDYMANCIYNRMKGDLPNVIKEYEGNQNTRTPIGGSFYTLIYALLLNELYRRRMSRRLPLAYPYAQYNY